jgi:hypothetical protein
VPTVPEFEAATADRSGGSLVVRCRSCGDLSGDRRQWLPPDRVPLWLLYLIRGHVTDGICPSCG